MLSKGNLSNMIKLQDVSIIRSGRPTLNNVSFEVKEGEHWALIGPNGAGATISGYPAACAAKTVKLAGSVANTALANSRTFSRPTR